jgi:senataxin
MIPCKTITYVISVETLHQTFELIRTIVGRIAKANPDLTKSTDLETTLQEIDKFARRAGTNYRSRLSDDLLSELADILDPFELSAADDEIQFVREQKTAESSSSRDREFKPLPPAVPVTTPAVKKNAFDELMRKAGAKSGSKNPTSSPSTSQQPKKPSTLTTNEKPKPKPIDLEEYENDDFMDGIDLQMLENKAKREVGMPKMARPPPVAPVRHQPTSAAESGPAELVVSWLQIWYIQRSATRRHV